MDNRRQVTREDILRTEALIAESYSQMKHSVTKAPSRMSRSLSQTVQEHPVAAAAAAVTGGLVVYGIIKLITSSARAVPDRSRDSSYNDSSRTDLAHEIFSMMIPLAAPYITGYLQKYLGRILSGERG